MPKTSHNRPNSSNPRPPLSHPSLRVQLPIIPTHIAVVNPYAINNPLQTPNRALAQVGTELGVKILVSARQGKLPCHVLQTNVVLPEAPMVCFDQWSIGIEALFADGTGDHRQSEATETGYGMANGGMAVGGNRVIDNGVDDVLERELIDDHAELGRQTHQSVPRGTLSGFRFGSGAFPNL